MSPTPTPSAPPWTASMSPTTSCTALGSGRGFEDADRRAAEIFARQARAAGVRRIVYLGGLSPEGIPERDLSPHLRSRAEVAGILLASGVPTAVLRAAVIIGSGSASFEMLRYLTERLPVMVTPQLGAHPHPADRRPRRAALPGRLRPPARRRQPDLRHRRARRPHLPRHDAALRPGRRAARTADPRRADAHPASVQPLGRPGHPRAAGPGPSAGRITAPRGRLPRARHRPLRPRPARRATPSPSTTRWNWRCAGYGTPRSPPAGPTPRCPARRATRCPPTPTGPAAASTPTGGSGPWTPRPRRCGGWSKGIGGDNGWYSLPLAWAVRGWLDRLVGGVGLRRGRRDAGRLRVGDSLDFWRVEEVVPGRLLRLRAEMRLPGLAWLELTVGHDAQGRTLYGQRALFHPHGLTGHAYWWPSRRSTACSAVWPATSRPPPRPRQPEFCAAIGTGSGTGSSSSRVGAAGRGRTVVVTATIDGPAGRELNPKRTGGSTSASGPRSAPDHEALTATTRWRSVAP